MKNKSILLYSIIAKTFHVNKLKSAINSVLQVNCSFREEKVKPIRQLGTGSNVYFETPKYRVNDFKGGKVLLNLNGDAAIVTGKQIGRAHV